MDFVGRISEFLQARLGEEKTFFRALLANFNHLLSVWNSQEQLDPEQLRAELVYPAKGTRAILNGCCWGN